VLLPKLHCTSLEGYEGSSGRLRTSSAAWGGRGPVSPSSPDGQCHVQEAYKVCVRVRLHAWEWMHGWELVKQAYLSDALFNHVWLDHCSITFTVDMTSFLFGTTIPGAALGCAPGSASLSVEVSLSNTPPNPNCSRRVGCYLAWLTPSSLYGNTIKRFGWKRYISATHLFIRVSRCCVALPLDIRRRKNITPAMYK